MTRDNKILQDITITEEVVEVAAENWDSGEALIRLLIESRKGRVAITDEAAASIARNFGGKMMGFILDRRGDAIEITEVVEAAVGNERSAEVLRVLLDRREDEVVITEEVVEMAAGNENNGEALIELLLDRPREKITMTEGAVASLERKFEGELRIATTKYEMHRCSLADTETCTRTAVRVEISIYIVVVNRFFA